MFCFWRLLLNLLFLNSFHVFAWGPVGHSMVVRLAQSQLTNETGEWIRSLTPWHWYGNLSAMSSWADDILYANSNPTGYANWQWSRTLHYINTPDWLCNYQYKRDCVEDVCIAAAINNYTKRLEDPLDEIQHKEALYFLIHFLGDIHQPLHTGFTSDRGGNSIQLRYMEDSRLTNLHSLWDSGLIATRLQNDYQSNTELYYEYLLQLMLNQPSIENDTLMDQWISENLHFVCSQIYLNEQNVTMNTSMNITLGEVYYERNIPIIEQRLALGGRRLGKLLSKIFQNRQANPSSKHDHLCTGTIVLIAVLGAELLIGILLGIIFGLRFRKRKPQSHSFSYSPNEI